MIPFACRGNERNKIFTDDQDREKFLIILGESLEKYRVDLHGYVLMSNHFYLWENSAKKLRVTS